MKQIIAYLSQEELEGFSRVLERQIGTFWLENIHHQTMEKEDWDEFVRKNQLMSKIIDEMDNNVIIERCDEYHEARAFYFRNKYKTS